MVEGQMPISKNERVTEEPVNKPCSKDFFPDKLAVTLASLMYGAFIITLYWVLTQYISWLIPCSIFLPTAILMLVAAIGLYLYSNKGRKYIFIWPAISFVTCILLAAFEKLSI